jgi:surfeit locus 1 family protein
MSADYAVLSEALQFKLSIRFRPQLIPTIAAIILITGMIKLGFWQYGKAEQKRALQVAYDARLVEAPVPLPETVSNIEDWRYRRIHVRGRFDPQYQILLDNQVEGDAAGYHVITPFRAANSKAVVLVDRGWIAMGERAKLPQIETPDYQLDIEGFAWVPSSKFYELSKAEESKSWQQVWENMDMPGYAKAVPFAVLPFVIRLDATSPAGFSRQWVKPAERIEMHVGYAWQWWGFSLAVAIIWLVVNFKREIW